MQQPARVVLPQISGDAFAGHSADACADLLDHDHQRIREQQRPSQLIAETCCCLRVGRDATRIIIRRSGNQARAQLGPDAVTARGGRLRRAGHTGVFLRHV
jgi:hypothetical protein